MELLPRLLVIGGKVMGVGKYAGAGVGMLVALFAYARGYSWEFLIGFCVLGVFHEGGHVLAAYERGFDVRMNAFFLAKWGGGNLREVPLDADTSAFIALAGPVAGSLASAVCFMLGVRYSSGLLVTVAFGGFVYNLVCLIPFPWFDGGRIARSVPSAMWIAGLVVLIAAMMWRPNPLLLAIGVMGVAHLERRRLRRRPTWGAEDKEAHFEANGLVFGVGYLTLVISLGLMADRACHLLRYPH